MTRTIPIRATATPIPDKNHLAYHTANLPMRGFRPNLRGKTRCMAAAGSGGPPGLELADAPVLDVCAVRELAADNYTPGVCIDNPLWGGCHWDFTGIPIPI